MATVWKDCFTQSTLSILASILLGQVNLSWRLWFIASPPRVGGKVIKLYSNKIPQLLLLQSFSFLYLPLQQARLAEVHRQELEALEVGTIPLRNYLIQHIMPTLNQGLIEAVKIRPDDPIDFLVSENVGINSCVFYVNFRV